MEAKEQVKVRFFGVDINDVKFNCHQFFDGKAEIISQIETGTYYPPETKREFKILMKMRIEVRESFVLEIQGIGSFSIDEDINDEIKKSIINKNCTAMMFPYMRSFISTFSSACGNVLGNIVLPVQYFMGDLIELTEKPSSDKPNIDKYKIQETNILSKI